MRMPWLHSHRSTTIGKPHTGASPAEQAPPGSAALRLLTKGGIGHREDGEERHGEHQELLEGGHRCLSVRAAVVVLKCGWPVNAVAGGATDTGDVVGPPIRRV